MKKMKNCNDPNIRVRVRLSINLLQPPPKDNSNNNYNYNDDDYLFDEVISHRKRISPSKSPSVAD